MGSTSTSQVNLEKYDWELFFNEFQSESPRAAVIISAAFLDSLLHDLLLNFLIDDPKSVDQLIGSEKQSFAPLASFGSRISACFCLGFLSKAEYDDLKIIQKIRNKFAHKLHGFSFDQDELVVLSNKLTTPLDENGVIPPQVDTPEKRYIFTVSYLLMQISLRVLEAGTEKRKIRNEVKVGQILKV